MNLVSLYLYLTKPPRGKVFLENLLVAYLVQKFPNFFMVPEALSVYQSPSLVKILSEVNEIHTRSHIFNVHFNRILPYIPVTPKWAFQRTKF